MSTRFSPDLDAPCGASFTYRELIECGETWRRLAAQACHVDNVPKQKGTFEGMRELCESVLDPLARAFAVPTITYAFAAPTLTKHIDGRIYPKGDQHAGSEVRPDGRPICTRLGFAVDFLVPGISAREIGRWLSASTPFDRLYYYGDDRPLHVSVGPENTRAVVLMLPGPSGRLIPRSVPKL